MNTDENPNPAIQMVDLRNQYQRIKEEVDSAVLECLNSTAFIRGPEVASFEAEFADYQGVKHVIGCGNGTDALQIALMGLNLVPGDEVIIPAFTYIATAEVVALLGLVPVLVDVDPQTFNVGLRHIEPFVTEKTRAIIPVHLYGQCADMEEILNFAAKNNLYVIEDAAQSIGVEYTFADGRRRMSGTMGTIGCTSFFPTKNLGCYGDGGALMTDDPELANRLRIIANHGQTKKYHHDLIGVNSRLDSIQAAILRVKLRHLNDYLSARRGAASQYDADFQHNEKITLPHRCAKSNHAFHQYTIKVDPADRDPLQTHLANQKIPSIVYYPLPLHHQKAFQSYQPSHGLETSEQLCREVLSLPVHTELDTKTLNRITSAVNSYF